MKNTPDLSYVNGKPEQLISVSDRGLNYGDGLFETILCLKGKPILVSEHLDRLGRDCQRLHIGLDEKKLLLELDLLSSLTAETGSSIGVTKIVITRKFSGRGYGYPKNSESNRLLQYYSGLSYPKGNQQGVRLSLCDHRLAINQPLAGIKHLNRLDQIIAQKSINKPFYQEGILFGSGGQIVECVSSNIFVVKDGFLSTPDLSSAGVQGVMRDYILSVVAPRLNLGTTVKKIYMDDLLLADEVFICNSVFGVWPAIAINVKQYPAGVITRAIQQEVNKLGYGLIYQ